MKKKIPKTKALLLYFEPFFQNFGYNSHHRVANEKSTQNHKNLHFILKIAYKSQLLSSCNNINKIQTFPKHNYMAFGTNNKSMQKKLNFKNYTKSNKTVLMIQNETHLQQYMNSSP
jgi:hypothetical protein